MTGVVRRSLDGGVARITLNRPERGNAISMELATEFRRAVREVLRDADGGDVRVVLLTGAGGAFCVGGDLAGFAAAEDRSEHIAELARVMHEAIAALVEAPVPVISGVHGAVAGAGVGLALLADLVVAASGTRFRTAYTGVGLSPDCGVSWVLGRTLGHAIALDLALTNRTLDAEEAERRGLVSRVVPPEELEGTLNALAGALASGPPAALAAAKRLTRAAGGSGLVPHLADEAAAIAELAAGPEAGEGIRAFLEKRSPRYRA